MNDFWKTLLWEQFGAAIDMLENAMRACPDELWSNTGQMPAWVSKSVVGFWYLVYLYKAARAAILPDPILEAD